MTYGNNEYSLRYLQERNTQGYNKSGDILWYSSPHESIQTEKAMYEGTIRSKLCTKNKGRLDIHGTCTECKNLLKSKEMEMRIRRSNSDKCTSTKGTDGTNNCCYSKTKNSCLSNSDKERKLKHYRAKFKAQRLVNLRLAKKLATSKSRKKKLSTKIREHANRGDITAIIENLNRAYKQGCLTGTSRTLKFLKDITANMKKKVSGRRYGALSKQIYDALRIIGGPRSTRLIAQNLCGPSETTQRRSRSKHRYKYSPRTPGEADFKKLRDIYQQIMQSKQISGPVLVETAEDEAVIISQVVWDSTSDECWGWCGEAGPEHKCDPAFVHVIGGDPDSYIHLKEAFKNNKLAGLARVIMFNPLHKSLPPLVVLLQATCNTFTHEMVREQWQHIIQLYNQYLLPVLGPLVGHASDGDSRRRKLHLQAALGEDGERYRINTENFTMSGKLVEVHGQKTLSGLSDQDYVHCGKKLINHLKHASRVLSIGGNVAHMNHLQLVLDNFHHQEHGLEQADIDREDRMNWESAQRLMFPKVQQTLNRLNQGDNVEPENVQGTMLYLKMCWRFTEIYLSFTATLLERIMYASYVVNFLRIWRLWVHKTGHLTLKENFVSRETFQDVSLACHHAVLIIKATRDFAAQHPVCLERTGTDVCEDYFSANGSFIMNKHNFTITDMFRNLGNMHR